MDLIRQWLAVRLVDWYEHATAIGHGILHAFGGREHDPLELAPEYVRLQRKIAAAVITDLPGAVPADGPPPPALHLLLTCEKDRGGCGAHVGAPCTTSDGRPTRPHKARRDPRRSRRQK